MYAYSTRLCGKSQTVVYQHLMKIKTNRYSTSQFQARNASLATWNTFRKSSLLCATARTSSWPRSCVKIVAGSFSGSFIEGKTVDRTRKWTSSFGSGFYFRALRTTSGTRSGMLTARRTTSSLTLTITSRSRLQKAEQVPFDLAGLSLTKRRRWRHAMVAPRFWVPLPDTGDLGGEHPVRAVIEGDDLAQPHFTLRGRWKPDPGDGIGTFSLSTRR